MRIFFNLTESSDFCIDSDKEYFGLSQHRGGYLKRIHTNYKAPISKNLLEEINRSYRHNRTTYPTNSKATLRYRHDKMKLEQAVSEVYWKSNNFRSEEGGKGSSKEKE